MRHCPLRNSLLLLGVVTALHLSTIACTAAEALPERVDFNRDIRPVLSDICFHCHGPDEEQRQADFRLDQQESAFADLGDHLAIAPGKPGASELYLRITAQDADERMPPVDSGRQLTARQIALIKKWIEQGAEWQTHWSFAPIRRPALPAIQHEKWSRNPIDAFVLAQLEAQGLPPSPPADKTRLIRRVTLDLTGLPPTIAEVDAFLADDSPGAYEKVVDRLLASPRYGERMATHWLDAARYADTNGYQTDGDRSMWRWRDWVIEAYNNNMPFDQFTIEQLAGDLLPEPTLEQRIATAFNRNHRGNGEGGVIEEEYAVEYVVDRVETTGTVWLGLTIGCARCHDHKYDPISQQEFYQLFSFFNNVPERGKAVKNGNSPPMMKAPTRAQRNQLDEVEERLAAAETNFAEFQPAIEQAERDWESTFDWILAKDWALDRALTAHFPFDGTAENTLAEQPVKEKTGDEEAPQEPEYGTGQHGEAAVFDAAQPLPVGEVGNFSYLDKFSVAAWISPRDVERGAIACKMQADEYSDGYEFCLHDGKLQVNLVKRWLDDAIRVETRESLVPGQWYHVALTYDGSRTAAGVKIYINGRAAELKINLDELNQDFNNDRPLLIGGGGDPQHFEGLIDEVRIYKTQLTAEEIDLLATPDTLQDIAAIQPAERTQRQGNKLRAYFIRKQAPTPQQDAFQELAAVREERDRLVESFPTVMVMLEMHPPRQAHVLLRGEYDKLGDAVQPGVPVSLPPFPSGESNNRLGLARWLISPDNPLTARVTVNRYWQNYFGVGLVKTAEDFGSQGEQPSHPQLLDWLAAEFIESGWDIKALQKTIVMSAAYRQSSKVTHKLWERDPENRQLARGPRQRLSAETIRDQALAAAGLLVEQIGGPSVKPYQPAGLWEEIANTTYTPGTDGDLFRRSMYTFWKRTVAPPTMMAFDASSRETCTVRQSRTNTPLQALALLNATTFVEAARNLAQRAMLAGGDSSESRLTYAFRLATARRPTEAELKILTAGFARHLAGYQANRTAAEELLKIGASPRDTQLDTAELAAYSAMAGLILNLDEVVTKE
ncbi:Planctomycete cytochrome C [Symmachiella macrocystis]|uniref:Planctomycete cytochrome C n=1 Tax=Symmachiella macrocystis TaxID=2527985 RepID=A0A5C6BC28_9PLAN|nr:DUF1553 domain-containing protein [Symmachiella macrocystis]TWU09633.1 Planctomycete cytochrome C [Symmachiella macrocystis]